MGVAVLKAQELIDHPLLPQAKSEEWRRFALHKYLKQVGNLRTQSTLEIGTDIEPQEGVPLFSCPDVANSLQGFVRRQSDYQIAFDVTKSTDIQLYFDAEMHCASLPYIQCLVREGQRLNLHMEFETSHQCWISPLTEIHLEKGAQLHIFRTDQSAAPALITDQLIVTQAQGSEVRLFNSKTGTAHARFAAHAILQGERAQIDVTGLCLVGASACSESVIDISHMARETLSNQLYHAVIADRAQSNYIGKIHVDQTAQKTDAQQLSRNLLLGPMATQFVKPELEIYADDVQCAHGATTGDLDEQALFYLRSRGISLAEAKATLIRAFCETPLDKLDLDHPQMESLKLRLEHCLKEVLV